jgi:hypothetical protein
MSERSGNVMLASCGLLMSALGSAELRRARVLFTDKKGSLSERARLMHKCQF